MGGFKVNKPLVVLLCIGVACTAGMLNMLMNYTPEPFKIEELSQSSADWEELEKEWERKNNLKMLESYHDLMKKGHDYTKNKNYHDAAACFWWAKTIFPKKAEPRRFLSESYLTLCSVHGEYCGDAKKEIYFAFNYIPEESNFYYDLMDMASSLDLHPYLDMNERDVLPIFFQEQTFFH